MRRCINSEMYFALYARLFPVYCGLLTDDHGSVPGSPRWWAFWNEQLHKYIARDAVVKDCKIPLEVLRAYIQSADPDMIEGNVES
jgi:hypothetical protein